MLKKVSWLILPSLTFRTEFSLMCDVIGKEVA